MIFSLVFVPDFKEIFNAWKVVFGNARYIFLTIIVALGFYFFNVLISNASLLIYVFNSSGAGKMIELLGSLIAGFGRTILLSSFISLIIISLLFGVLASLFVFKIKAREKNTKLGVIGGLGVLLGVIAPGCAACGIGLLSVLGLGSAFLTFLPFEGLELSILAILLLNLTILKASKDLTTCKVCQIHMKKTERRTRK